MNQKVLRVLEYNKIIERLTDKATSEQGRKLAAALEPMTDLEAIGKAQTETADALGYLFRKGSTSFGGNKDLGMCIRSLEIGSVLSIEELLRIAAFLENVNRIKSYGRKEREDAPADSLDVYFESLEPLTPLSNEIRRCILSEEEIADDASPALKKIRRSMTVTNDRIHSQLASMINGSCRTYLQDAVVTMRNNRYCIPVKSEYKGQVQGMVHDQSSTGSTFFIEPAAVVSLNNELRELEIREQEEIAVILADLSAQAGAYTELLMENQKAMTALDFIFAKAALALEQNATMPVFHTEHKIRIRQGRHPLLDKKKVVPIDIQLGIDFDLLVITGPNTGGMGAVSPVPFADGEFMDRVERSIVQPTLEGLRADGIPYSGFLFIGLMNVDGYPMVIEYNVRMGDPETEAVMLRVDSDLLQLMNAAAHGDLGDLELKENPQTAVTVMMVSGGYPGSYPKGKEITGLDTVSDSIAFHAGTSRGDDGRLVTSGGRVISVSSLGSDIAEALDRSYRSIAGIDFEGKYSRRDIGRDLMKLQGIEK